MKRIILPHAQEKALKERIEEAGAGEPLAVPEVLDICRDIKAYFGGAPLKVPWAQLSLEDLTPLQRKVLEAVARVPYGKVRSYGQIAAQVGRPLAYRFVGTALARNPFPILIPCHRVILADGSPGHFRGGRDLKKRMLALEQSEDKRP